MRPLLLALQFLTVVMFKPGLSARQGELAKSLCWYGAVGGLLGLALGLAAWGLALALPVAVAAVLTLALWAGFTRFLHLDGVADCGDALIYYAGRERALEIMKDTGLGSFGAGSLCLLLLLKFAALLSIPPSGLLAALICACALSRAAAALAATVLPPARPGSGLGSSVASGAKPAYGLVSAAFALALAVAVAGLAGALAALAVLGIGVVLGAVFMWRLQGVTGDCLGCLIEVSEATALVVFAVCLG